jgi:hypothetical protein
MATALSNTCIPRTKFSTALDLKKKLTTELLGQALIQSPGYG